MAKLERIDDTDGAKEVLLERDDADVALDILNELGQAPEDTNWKFTVCRINTDKNGVAINGALEPQILEGDASIMDDLPGRLREQFGTGRYRVRILMNKRLWKRFDIAVERPIQPTPVPTAIPQQSELGAVLAAFGKQQEQIIALLSRPPATPVAAPAAIDPMAMLDKCFSLVQKLQPAAPSADAITAPEKALELIMKGVDLAEKVGGDGRQKGVMDLISDALNSPLVEKMLAGTMGTIGPQPSVRLPPSQPRRQAPAAPAKEPAKDTPPAPEASQEQITAEQIKRTQAIILWLLERANHGSSYETYAEWAFDNLPPPLIMGLLADTDPIATISGLVPQIAPQKQWFISLIDDLRELVNTAKAADAIDNNVPGRGPSPINSNPNAGWQGGGANDIEDDDGIGEGG